MNRTYANSSRPALARSAWLLLAALIVLLIVEAAPAAVVLLKGEAEPVRGIIRRQDEASIVIAVPQADGSLRDRTIPRDQIDDILHSVSAERLTALDPAEPREYRNYAEELAEKRADPEARAAALRLFLIAAHLDSERLGRSSILGMISLARSPAEERKLRALGALVDPTQAAALLRPAAPPPAASLPDDVAAASTPSSGNVALDALRLYRQGKSAQALAKIKQPGAAEAFVELGASFTLVEFMAACGERSQAGVNDPIFAQVIAVELAQEGLRPALASSTEGTGWGPAAARGPIPPAPILTLEHVLEFDPRESLYRDGRWVAP